MNFKIETERLVLREFELTDSEDFYKLNLNPNVLKFTGDLPFGSIDKAEEFIKNYNDYKLNGFGRWAVILKENNKFIGWCGLKLNEENLVDLGFRFFEEEWNKGFATESAKACLEYGVNNLHLKTIIGRASISNIASFKVLEKIGMKFWKEEECEGLGLAKYYIFNSD